MSLATDSIDLARQIDNIRKRHSGTKWPKHEGMKRDLLEMLRESSWLLKHAARTLQEGEAP